MGDPAFEGIEGDFLIFNNQNIDLGFKGAHILMCERCHKITFFSHFKNECVKDKTDRQI